MYVCVCVCACVCVCVCSHFPLSSFYIIYTSNKLCPEYETPA